MAVIIAALLLAIGVNCYFFISSSDLTLVVSRTLFADLILVLSLVPIYQSVVVRQSDTVIDMPTKLKSGMKAVVTYTLLVALATYILIKLFGEPLIGARLFELNEALSAAVSDGNITTEQKEQQFALAKQIYSPATHILIVLLGNLLIGFVSAVLAAALVRK